MDPVEQAELTAQLEKLKAELKKLSVSGGKVTGRTLSDFHPCVAEVVQKQKAKLREAYRNRKPRIFDLRRLNSSQSQPPVAPSPMLIHSLRSMSVSDAFSEDGEGKEA